MNRRVLMLGQMRSLADLEALTFEFEKVLKIHGLDVTPGSDLERASLNVLNLLGKHLDPGLQDPLEDIRPYYCDALGLWSFMTKIVRLKDHPSFPTLVPHLALLNKGGVGQNQKSIVSDTACNKLFELLMALICMDAGVDLALDDPDESVGDNPDVICTIGCRRWGFACKVPFRDTPKSLFDNVKKGIDQIQVSDADVGCVVLNYRNLIDHAATWPILNEADVHKGAAPLFGCHRNPWALATELHGLVRRQQTAMANAVGLGNVQSLFNGKKCLPGFLVFCQTATGVSGPRGPVPHLVGSFVLCDYGDCAPYMSTLTLLNDAMHEIPCGHGP